jgi:hypothetical protein
MILSLILGIIICMILGYSAINRIGRDTHHDSRPGSYYYESHKKKKH